MTKVPADDVPASEGGTLFDGTVRRALAVLIVAALALAAWTLSHVLLLAFAAVLIAVLLRHAAAALAGRTPLGVGAALAVVLLAVVTALAVFVLTLGPRILREGTRIADVLPETIARLETWLGDRTWGQYILDSIPMAGADGPDLNLVGTIGGTLATAIGVATSLLVLVSVAIFLALDPGLYRRGVLHLVPKARRGRAGEVMDALGRNLWRWLLGQLADMAVVAVLTGVGLWIAGVPLAITLGLIAGLTNFIPYVGPFLSAVPAIAIAFAHDPTKALWAAGVFVLVQQFEGHVLMPVIQKRAASLPPVLSILAIVAFGVLFGFLGIVVATPLLLVTIVLVRMLYVEDVLGDRTAG